MADPTSPAPDNVDLVVPKEVAPSGHGGTGEAPLPHPLTAEANRPAEPGEVSDPDTTNDEADGDDK